MRFPHAATRLALPVLLGLQACSSAPVLVAPTPPARYERLGPVEGRACGALGLLATAYYAIPMGLNSRVERARAEALASRPGATGLINVTIQDEWAWVVLATTRCTTLTAEAIREIP
ncbi:MAG: hypothetical protein REI09_03755 [Candidatus Dactylopiibacterium sp.]|nr:hypothetical protein [Candidatus Dactylopiibacterium sp.]